MIGKEVRGEMVTTGGQVIDRINIDGTDDTVPYFSPWGKGEYWYIFPYYTPCTCGKGEDKGKKALEVVKMLKEKGYIERESVELIEEVMKLL